MTAAAGLDVVHTFLVLAEELNFRSCALRLNIDQSAVTRRIQKLEHALSVRLLDRTTRKVRLTPAGHVFYKENVRLVAGYDESVRRARRVAQGKAGAIRVGYMTFAGAELVPAHAARFQAARPDVHVTLTYMHSAAQKQALANGEIDIGYVLGRFEHPDFRTRPLEPERLFLVGAQHEALTERTAPRPDEIAEARLVTGDTAEWGDYTHYLEALFSAEGLRMERAFETANIQAQFGLIRAGLGVGIYPEGLARSAPQGTIARPVANPRFVVAQTIVWNASNPNGFAPEFASGADLTRC